MKKSCDADGSAGGNTADACAPAVPSPHWTDIAGIDARAATARVNNDVELHLSLLARVMREFGDLAGSGHCAPLHALDGDALARRAHKLAGGASQVGALDVARDASALEHSLRGVQGSVAPCAARNALAISLRTVLDASTPVLAARERRMAASDRALHEKNERLSPAQRSDLLGLLMQGDLSVLDRVATLAPGLLGELGFEQFALLRRALENLDFAAAAGICTAADRHGA